MRREWTRKELEALRVCITDVGPDNTLVVPGWSRSERALRLLEGLTDSWKKGVLPTYEPACRVAKLLYMASTEHDSSCNLVVALLEALRFDSGNRVVTSWRTRRLEIGGEYTEATADVAVLDIPKPYPHAAPTRLVVVEETAGTEGDALARLVAVAVAVTQKAREAPVLLAKVVGTRFSFYWAEEEQWRRLAHAVANGPVTFGGAIFSPAFPLHAWGGGKLAAGGLDIVVAEERESVVDFLDLISFYIAGKFM